MPRVVYDAAMVPRHVGGSAARHPNLQPVADQHYSYNTSEHSMAVLQSKAVKTIVRSMN